MERRVERIRTFQRPVDVAFAFRRVDQSVRRFLRKVTGASSHREKWKFARSGRVRFGERLFVFDQRFRRCASVRHGENRSSRFFQRSTVDAIGRRVRLVDRLDFFDAVMSMSGGCTVAMVRRCLGGGER